MRRLLATIGLMLSALACHHGRNHHVAPVPSAVCDGQDDGDHHDQHDPCDEDRD